MISLFPGSADFPNWCDQPNCGTQPLGQLKKSAFPRKKPEWDWTKVIVDHKTLSEGRERYFIYCQGTAIKIDLDSHQLWSETTILAEWFHSVGGKWMNKYNKQWNRTENPVHSVNVIWNKTNGKLYAFQVYKSYIFWNIQCSWTHFNPSDVIWVDQLWKKCL